MRKNCILLTILLCCIHFAYGQTTPYNAYVQNVQWVVPPTASGFECGTTQSATFTMGLSTAADANQWATNPLTIVICVTGFVFDATVANSISGTYASNFNWSFNSFAPNCLYGVQNQPLIGVGSNPGSPNPLSSGSLIVTFKVPENTALNTVLGMNVNLQIPGYMVQNNNPVDDVVLIQTVGFCGCYNFIGNAGSIGSNQTFYNNGDPAAFTSITPGTGGSGGTIVYQWEELVASVWTEISGETNLTYDAPSTSITRSYRRKAKRTSCGTWKNSSPVTVSIVVPDAGVDKTITCATTSAVIGTTAIPGQTYSWSPTTGLSSTSVAMPIATPSSTTTYTVTMSNSSGATATDVVVVNVNTTPPSVGVNVSASAICLGSSATLTGTGAATYFWEPVSIDDLSIVVYPEITSTYTVTGTGSNGCVATTTQTIIVNPVPNVGSTATSSTVCLGSSTTLTGTGADIYTWNFGASYSPTLTVTPNLTSTYVVIGTNTSTGCTNLSVRIITVIPSPNVNTTASPTTVCAGSSATINATGGVTYFWQPGALSGSSITVSPNVTTTYTVTGTASNGCTKTATRIITVNPCGSTLNLKLYIQGYYTGGGLMTPALFNEVVVGAPNSVTDSITVELRNTSSPYAVFSSIKTVLNTNGTATCVFPTSGTYYIAIKHRNGLQTWSANPVILGSTPLTYDFSNASSKAYGSNQVELETGVWGLFSGDINLDENIDLLDLGIIDADVAAFEFGYFSTDVNGDGNVDLLDVPAPETNTQNFIFALYPQ